MTAWNKGKRVGQKKRLNLKRFGVLESLIYAKTKNLRAIQLLLGHSKLQSTIEYLRAEIEDALSISENTET